MTKEQQDEFVRMVDEMRRLQQVTLRPPTPIAARMLRLAEGTVDLLLMKYREPDPVESATVTQHVLNPTVYPGGQA